MNRPVGVVVEAHDFSPCVDARGNCPRVRARKVDGGEFTLTQQKTVGSGGIAVVANDLSGGVDPSDHRAHHGARKVDGGEFARILEEAVLVSSSVVVGTNDLALIIQVLEIGSGGAGKVQHCENTILEQVA